MLNTDEHFWNTTARTAQVFVSAAPGYAGRFIAVDRSWTARGKWGKSLSKHIHSFDSGGGRMNSLVVHHQIDTKWLEALMHSAASESQANKL